VLLEENGEDKMVRERTNEELFVCSRDKKMLLNKTLHRNLSWIGHILRRICLLPDAIEGQMAEIKRVGRTRTQFLDDFRNSGMVLGTKGGYWRSKKMGSIFLSYEHKEEREVIFHKSI